MATTPNVPVSQTPAPSAGVIWSTILGDLLFFGELAAQIFVKNPGHAAQAGKIIQAVNTAIPVVQSQIAGQ